MNKANHVVETSNSGRYSVEERLVGTIGGLGQKLRTLGGSGIGADWHNRWAGSATKYELPTLCGIRCRRGS